MKTWLIFSVLFGVCFTTNSFAQLQTTSFEVLEKQQKDEPKNTLIFIQTNWCSYCHAMKRTTLKNKKIENLINEKYYFINLDAEEKRTITYLGKAFHYIPHGTKTGIHELALHISQENNLASYPLILVISPQNQILFKYSGFLNAQELHEILQYFNLEKVQS